jgi:hypothetical protein
MAREPMARLRSSHRWRATSIADRNTTMVTAIAASSVPRTSSAPATPAGMRSSTGAATAVAPKASAVVAPASPRMRRGQVTAARRREASTASPATGGPEGVLTKTP